VLQKRGGQDADDSLDRTSEIAAYETTRSATESSSDKGGEPKKDDETHISLFWRVFGGTILSIVALVSITLFNNMSTSISELRAEVSREREARAELVKKDEFNARVSAQYERMRGIDTVKVELEGLKEKVHTNATTVEAVKRDTGTAIEAVKKETSTTADSLKKDAAALEVLKERVAMLEGVKKDLAGLDALKEKLTTAVADLKTLRDDVQKVTGEVDRNKTSDLERKAIRDSQYKQTEETLKEVQKAIQDCREKLARLEGAQPKPAMEVPIPFARPVAPSTAKPPTGATAPAKPTPPSEVKPVFFFMLRGSTISTPDCD